MSMFLTVYEADHIAMEGYQLKPITEGFLGDLWNRVVEIFKKIWDRIVKTVKAIKDFLFRSKKELDDKEKDEIYKQVINENHDHEFIYDHKELIAKFDWSYNAFNDLLPVAIKLKEGSKHPDKFNPAAFKSQNMTSINKWCNVDDNGERIAISLDKNKVAPVERINKMGTITHKESLDFAATIEAYTIKYSRLKENSQKILGGHIDGIIDVDKYKDSIHFIRGAVMTLANVLMTLSMSMDHTLHCMVSEFSACTKDLNKKPIGEK